jgi:hypothetical protein
MRGIREINDIELVELLFAAKRNDCSATAAAIEREQYRRLTEVVHSRLAAPVHISIT